MVYFISVILIQFGIFATRWNVVIAARCSPRASGGSPRTRWSSAGSRGCLRDRSAGPPVVILFVLLKILPPWKELREEGETGAEAARAGV